ncbi:cytochrome P450 [Nocardia yamanashiensis]|uniref:cytochrome P450 n=1 Tax=Nocardia yamanashiensis TaxID=209247 RepID=UPI001E55D073|nr:cytochrome P450 [Nocardia yamanashiensis]UGT41546.1 cytochrome P450 [Nocardia yamanashiensis]
MTMASVAEIDIFDPAHLEDPYPMYRMLREHAPVYRVPGTDFYLISSWELVSQVCARTEVFSSNLTATLIRQPDGAAAVFDMDHGGQAVHVLATADDPDHRQHRKLVSTVLSKRIRAMGPTVEELIDSLWVSELRDGRIDWATGMADRLPLALVAAIIGLPSEDVPRLLDWAYDSTEMLGGVVPAERMGPLIMSAAELTGYLYEQLTAARTDAARRDSGQDLLGVLARAVEAGELPHEVAVLNLVQLVGAGGESTAGLIASAARILATDPGLQNLLREQPHRIPAFLDEALRLESPFRGHHRHVVSDTELGGVPLPAGSHLLLLWGAANRDPAVFPDPDALDLDRTTSRHQMAFGKGIHFCVGSPLAKLEAHAAISALLDRSASFSLIEDAAPMWVPSLFVRRHQTLPLKITTN